jgi:hypothetical protein
MKSIVSAVSMIVLSCTIPALGQGATVTVKAGHKFTSKLTDLSDSCTPILLPVRFTQLPRYGRVRIYRSTDFQRDHPNSACNNRIVPAIAVEYRAPSAFTGQDQFSLIFGTRQYRLQINIVP